MSTLKRPRSKSGGDCEGNRKIGARITHLYASVDLEIEMTATPKTKPAITLQYGKDHPDS
jgi:hypothetical protein